MAHILARRSNCEDPSDYESLLASLSMVKSVIDCDQNGHLTGPSVDILSKLFRHGDGNGNVLWYSDVGVDKNDMALIGPDDELLSDITDETPYSCFRDTEIFFYGKKCNFNKCIFEVAKKGCIKDAVEMCYPF